MGRIIETDLKIILTILENSTRRDIIKRLSEEPNYPLQLAKDLGLGQQLVAKHLQIMEDAGIVTSSNEFSPHGPKRRIYVLNKSVSLTLDVATHLFKAKVISFDAKPERERFSESSASLMDRMDRTLEHPEEHERIKSFTAIISEIDNKLEALEDQRSILLYIRNQVMKEAAQIIETFENSNIRRILHHAMNEHDINIGHISESLNLRESVVHQALLKLKKDLDIGVEHVEEETKGAI
ncbi:MAG: ArsR family transcriptional regulator [Candidatus Bathyarchaeota archaeon]